MSKTKYFATHCNKLNMSDVQKTRWPRLDLGATKSRDSFGLSFSPAQILLHMIMLTTAYERYSLFTTCLETDSLTLTTIYIPPSK